MGKRKPTFTVDSHGRYSKWDKSSKELPKIEAFTDAIPAVLDTEFGMILNIKGGKGERIDFVIKHPTLHDENGNMLPDFKGEVYVHSNDYQIFIGDSVFAPAEDKIGPWHILVYWNKKCIAEKAFNVIPA